MRALIGLVVLFISTILIPTNVPAKTLAQQQKVEASSKAGLKISLVPTKHRYKRNQNLRFYVMLTNISYESFFVVSMLEWGLRANLMFHIHDASGKEIEPRGFPDSSLWFDRNDKSAFLKLDPNRFIGVDFNADLKFLNITKPGKYSVYVEYWAKDRSNMVAVEPFWGDENGTIFSNLVWFEVVR